MNAQEAIALCRFVKGACPQQAIDEFTPDAWHVLLEPYRFEDCRQAAVEIARESPFVAPAEIIARVKSIRGKRIADFGPIEPPPEVAASERHYREWLADTRRAIADGELQPVALPANPEGQRQVMRAIGGTFQTVPAYQEAKAAIVTRLHTEDDRAGFVPERPSETEPEESK